MSRRKKLEVRPLGLRCLRDAARGQVDTRHAEPFRRQVPRMTPGAAAKVEHRCRRAGLESRDERVDES